MYWMFAYASNSYVEILTYHFLNIKEKLSTQVEGSHKNRRIHFMEFIQQMAQSIVTLLI